MKDFISEFKAFAMRGNVIDLAIAVVIGAAFSQITNSLVNNILTPFIGLLIGGFDFSSLAIPLGGDASLGYGVFLQAIFNFIIIAFALFLILKLVNRLTKRQKKDQKAVETAELAVLKEIRDELKTHKA